MVGGSAMSKVTRIISLSALGFSGKQSVVVKAGRCMHGRVVRT